MSSVDLTTLSGVKSWLGVNGTADDALLSALVTAASQAALDFMGRPFLAVTQYVEDYTAYQVDRITLRQYPVQSVASIDLGGTVVTAQAAGFPPVNGFLLEPANLGRPQRVTLFGYRFSLGEYSARITYTAGYQTVETHIIAALPTSTNLTSLGDLGVTINGTAATAVSGTPATGQYTVTAGTYTFASADYGKTAVISFSSPPPPVELAIKEMVGEAYKRRDRIGQTQRNLPNVGTVTTPMVEMTPTAKMMLSAYRRAMPV